MTSSNWQPLIPDGTVWPLPSKPTTSQTGYSTSVSLLHFYLCLSFLCRNIIVELWKLTKHVLVVVTSLWGKLAQTQILRYSQSYSLKSLSQRNWLDALQPCNHCSQIITANSSWQAQEQSVGQLGLLVAQRLQVQACSPPLQRNGTENEAPFLFLKNSVDLSPEF